MYRRTCPTPVQTQRRLPEQDAQLARRALAVLDANWLGHATKPSPRLYPHQWSWDSACIAMGYARWNQDRAETELRSLFAGQWRNGLLPHIVFARGDGRYFPGPDFWQVRRSPDAPAGLETSGIVQPPIHATAAWRVYGGRKTVRGEGVPRRLAPKLAAWHAYLYRERTRGSDGLVEIWHPGSRAWTTPPSGTRRSRGSARLDEIPEYRRVDAQLADPAERRRTTSTTGTSTSSGSSAARLPSRQDPGATPFALQAALFNSLLVQSNRDLAEIAPARRRPRAVRAWAAQTAAGVDAKLWDEEAAVYVDYDVAAGRRVGVRTAGLAPLHAGIPSGERPAG